MIGRVLLIGFTLALSGCIIDPPDGGEFEQNQDDDIANAVVVDSGTEPEPEEMNSGREPNNVIPLSSDAGPAQFNDATDENGRPRDAMPSQDAGPSESFDPDAELDDGREPRG